MFKPGTKVWYMQNSRLSVRGFIAAYKAKVLKSNCRQSLIKYKIEFLIWQKALVDNNELELR